MSELPNAPLAKQIPKNLTIHDDVRIDEFYWLNDRENPEVIDYLNKENDYYNAHTSHTKDFQVSLFDEMKSRIKEDDSSVPYKYNGYWYITKYEKGKDYPIYVRKKETLEAAEELLFDCNEMAKDPGNFILNQFCEFGNHVGHYEVTGRALAHAFEHVKANGHSDIRLAAFTSATGSAGTIAAGDRLKDIYGTKIVAVEALECPTMLENGFGEHNIQGIGDKHIPLIHNVMNTDVVVGVSDRATDELDVLFNAPAGQQYLASRHGFSAELIDALTHFGFSAICNVLAAIKTAKLMGYGANDAIVTIATDGGALYPSERVKTIAGRFKGEFTAVDAAEIFSEHLGSVSTDNMIDCTERDRNRIFNLGYYTWVEQQGTPLDVFEARRSQSFWRSVRSYAPVWDNLITEFNARVAKAS